MRTDTNPSMPLLAEDRAREVCLRISAQSGKLAENPEFIEFIEHGVSQLTPRTLAALVSEIPDIRAKLPELQADCFPQTGAQLSFLIDVVEGAVLKDPLFHDLPWVAALEAAFAIQYFHRTIDLIPDSLGVIGYTDDAVVAAAVLARNADAFEELAANLRRDWSAIFPIDVPA